MEEVKWPETASHRSIEHQSTITPELKTRRLDLLLASYMFLPFDLHYADIANLILATIKYRSVLHATTVM